jgi:hypothetical protein
MLRHLFSYFKNIYDPSLDQPLKANILHEDRYIQVKFLFPHNWEKKKITRKIGEAYDNCSRRSGSARPRVDGQYLVKWFTNDGLCIEILFKPDGTVAVAYPKF